MGEAGVIPGEAADPVPTPTPRRGDGAALERAASLSRPVSLAGEHTLAVLPALVPWLPDEGLRRGTTVAVEGPGATSLAVALAIGAVEAGSWLAGLALFDLGLQAVAHLGLPLERLVLVADPGSSTRGEILATLIDSFDLVLVGGGATGTRATAVHRRLQARGRERGTVLVSVGGSGGFEPDLRVRITASRWHGLAAGAGHLRAREVAVEARGRRAAVRPRRAVLWLPAAEGGVQVASSDLALTAITPPAATADPPAALAG